MRQNSVRPPSRLLLAPPPAMLSISISSFCECSRRPRSVCHREHKLFSLGCCDSMIGVYKQAYQAGMTCTPLTPSSPAPQTSNMSFLLSLSLPLSPSLSLFLCLSLTPSVPCMRWVTQAAALGIPGQLIILHPWDTAHCKLGHQTMQAC